MIDIIYYSDKITELLETLELLEFKKVIVVSHLNEIKNITEYDNELKKLSSKVEVYSGIIFDETCLDFLRKINVEKRRMFDVLLIRGGNLKLNREAVQNVFVDFLINPFENREDAGIDHIFAKKASINDVGIVIDISKFNSKSLYEETKEYQKILEIAKLCRKYKVAFFPSSFAKKKYELKDYKFFEAFEYVFGFEEAEIKENWRRIEKILIENRKKRGENWIMPGVEVI